jgi:hypothetical protein
MLDRSLIGELPATDYQADADTTERRHGSHDRRDNRGPPLIHPCILARGPPVRWQNPPMADNDAPTVPELADNAAEAIRSINHATSTLEYTGDIYSTIANLKILAQRLPQAYEQLGGRLTQLGHDGHLRIEPGRGDLADAQDATYDALREAIVAAQVMEAALDRAHSALGPIGYQD